ncbi:MAG TPA: hypothetical protein VFH76_23560, partial [Kribbella sp.]|nr:hypothetical protein [Kribbella sp.]
MTATKTGAAVDPGSREYNWVRTIVELVEKNTGQSSRWNGKLHLEEGDALGTAHADGTMTVSDAKVLEPLRKAFAGQPLSDDEQFLLRDALVTLTHESLHLAGTIVDEHGQVRYTDADAALEEGLTETWAQQNVDHAIYALGLDRTYPGLVNQSAVDAYPALQAASDKLVAGVATLSGLRETEVVRRMQATPVHERFEVLADLAIEQRMGGVMGAEKDAVRAELVRPLHEQFGKLMAVQGDDTLDYTTKAQQGSVIGSQALTSFSQALLQAEPPPPP